MRWFRGALGLWGSGSAMYIDLGRHVGGTSFVVKSLPWPVKERYRSRDIRFISEVILQGQIMKDQMPK